MLIEEIRQIRESKKDLKKFGLTVGPVLIAIAAILLIKRNNSAAFWGCAGVLILVLSFAAPAVLKPLNRIWMSFSIVLGWIMTRLILIILFYLALTPMSIVARLLRKDLLDRRIDRSVKSYWQKRESKNIDAQSYERQF